MISIHCIVYPNQLPTGFMYLAKQFPSQAVAGTGFSNVLVITSKKTGKASKNLILCRDEEQIIVHVGDKIRCVQGRVKLEINKVGVTAHEQYLMANPPHNVPKHIITNEVEIEEYMTKPLHSPGPYATETDPVDWRGNPL